MAAAWFNLRLGEITTLWAGDSRVYLLTPRDGLQQVTTDDLKTGGDALENLVEDSPMSNCLSADADFIIHQRTLPIQPPFVVFAASDGCFGYVSTPLHFEHLLLSAMNQAQSMDDWRTKLSEQIDAVAEDDSTLAGAIAGWSGFSAMKADFVDRQQRCAVQVRHYDQQAHDVARLQRELGEAKKALADGRQKLWDEYRKTYEALQGAETADVRAEIYRLHDRDQGSAVAHHGSPQAVGAESAGTTPASATSGGTTPTGTTPTDATSADPQAGQALSLNPHHDHSERS